MSGRKARIIWYWLAQWMCRLFCILIFDIRVYGEENVPDEGGFLLVSNHQSYLDPVFCGVALKRRLHFLARSSLFSNWFFRFLILSLNAISVERGTADVSAMKKVISKLKESNGVCLFPEATRTKDGKISAFKPGFGLLCRRGDAAIVPVVIDGAFECWPRHKKIFSRGRVVVCYGKVVTAEQSKQMGDRKLAERLTEALRQMQNDCRVKHGKEPIRY